MKLNKNMRECANYDRSNVAIDIDVIKNILKKAT